MEGERVKLNPPPRRGGEGGGYLYSHLTGEGDLLDAAVGHHLRDPAATAVTAVPVALFVGELAQGLVINLLQQVLLVLLLLLPVHARHGTSNTEDKRVREGGVGVGVGGGMSVMSERS